MQNFTTSKDAQIVDVSGLVNTESVQDITLQIGDSIPSGTVLMLAQNSEITLAFDDGTEQLITGTSVETLTNNVQTAQQTSEPNAAASESLQDEIDAIQASIESGGDIELPDTAAGGLSGNEGTDFVTLNRDGNELLAGAGYDTGELENAPLVDLNFVDPVNLANSGPEALDDNFGVNENTVLNGNVLLNDELGDEVTTVTGFDNTSVNGGTVTVDADGNFTYTPVTDFAGTDTFTYTITDADGDTSTASVIVNVNALAEAVDDTFGIDENTALTGTLLGNDDLGDEVTTVTAFNSTSVNGGTVTVDANGNFTYTPVTDFVGTDTFTYTITDADADTSTATVTINVQNVNVPPAAADDSFSVNEGQFVGGNVITHDDGDGVIDTDGGDGVFLKVTQVNGVPISGDAIFIIIDGVLSSATAAEILLDSTFDGVNDNGILRINENGEFTYENKGFFDNGTTTPTQPSFEYTLSDGIDTDTARVTIEVSSSGPVANGDDNFILLTKINGTDTAFSSAVKGNVVGGGSSGDQADASGADGFGLPIITQITYGVNNDTYVFSDAVTSHTILTDFGTLTINSSGAYTFVTIDGMELPNEIINLVFNYTIQDGDTLNPDTSSAELNIEIDPQLPVILSKDMSFDETSGTIDTDFGAEASLHVDGAAFLYSPDTDDLSDILTDGHSGGLEKYLAVMGDDDGSMVNVDLSVALKDFQVEEAVVLEKGDADSEYTSFTTVTNGLLAGGGTIISEAAAATNTPIAELDSSDLL